VEEAAFPKHPASTQKTHDICFFGIAQKKTFRKKCIWKYKKKQMFSCGQQFCKYQENIASISQVNIHTVSAQQNQDAMHETKAFTGYLGAVTLKTPLFENTVQLVSQVEIGGRLLTVHVIDAQQHNLSPDSLRYSVAQLKQLSPMTLNLDENKYDYYLCLLISRAIAILEQDQSQITKWVDRVNQFPEAVAFQPKIKATNGELLGEKPTKSLMFYRQLRQQTLVRLVPVDILFNIQQYMYFLHEYTGFVGIDEVETTIVALCNIPKLDNAYFTNQGYMIFGNGDKEFFPLASLDVVGHELGHGVVQRMGDLEYSGESGALNESIADVLGTLFEFHMYEKFNANESKQDDLFGNADWLMGKDLQMNGKYLRNMASPTSASQPQPDRYKGPHYVSPTSNIDFGGVHINSGIPNYCYYLLSQELGKKESFRLLLQCYKQLPRTATFLDYRRALLTKCKNTDIVSKVLARVNLTEESLLRGPRKFPRRRI
jgi:hypothetical protein